jgi:hypothetical protein
LNLILIECVKEDSEKKQDIIKNIKKFEKNKHTKKEIREGNIMSKYIIILKHLNFISYVKLHSIQKNTNISIFLAYIRRYVKSQ